VGFVAWLVLSPVHAAAQASPAPTPAVKPPVHAWTLPELVERSRKNDARVHEAAAELRNLQAKSREAFWAWFPKLETTFMVGGPTPEARNDGFGGPPTTPATVTYDLNFGKPGVMTRVETGGFIPLYTFGKLSALREAGRQGVTLGENNERRVRDEVTYQTAQAFFGYQLARMGKTALADTETRLEEASRLIDRLLGQESTQVTPTDRFKVEYYRKQVQARVGQTESGMTFARAALQLIAGFHPNETFDVAPQDLEAPQAKLKTIDEYVALAAANRPELKMVSAGVALRTQEVLIRERMFYPDLALAGFFRAQYTSSATRQRSPFAYDPYNDLAGGFALVVRSTFDIPIKNAQLDQSRAELAKLEAQQRLLTGAVRLEIEKLVGDLKDALGRSVAYADAERSARRWSTAAFANFEVGTGDTRELVDAFGAYAIASAEKLKGWHDAQLALWALSKAVGAEVR
jgi:outer membrane protein TolC